MKISLSALAVFLIISIGAVVRLYRVNQPLLEFFPPRQTQTAEITRNIYINGWPDFWTPKVRYFTGSPVPYVLEFPLYNSIVAAFYYIFGPNIILGRIVSLIFFIVSSMIFYKLVKRTTAHGEQLAIFSLIFFVFSPLHILVSRTFQPEELAILLLLGSVYFSSWTLFSLAILVKLPIVLFSPIMLLVNRRKNQILNKSSLTKLFLSLLPAILWYRRASIFTAEEHVARNFTLSNWFQPNLWLTPRWYWALFQIETVWMFTTTGLIIFIAGIWSLRKKQFKLWKLWLICGILYLILFNFHAMTHEYYHILLLPPIAIIMGQGLKKIFSLIPDFLWIKIIAISVITGFTVFNLIKPALDKISRSPKTAAESSEINVDRYNLTTTFR